MEQFKTYDELTKPDERNTYFYPIDNETEETIPLKLDDIHKAVEQIQINDNALDDVISQFNVAKNLAVYSWFSYPFHQIAEMKAFSCVEMALKIKLEKKRLGLCRLLEMAVNQGLLKDSGFNHIDVNPDNPIQYVQHLPKILPKLRNELAHGSTTLHPGSITCLRICADIINQLFGSGNEK